RRIVRKQLDAAQEELTGEHKRTRDGAVHEVRKCFKRVRAVLRLVRPELGEGVYKAENSCFRDAARPLTEVRDAKIFIETVDALVEHFEEHVAGRMFNDIRKMLQTNLRKVRKRVLDQQNAFAVAAETVREARDRVADWPRMPNRWSTTGAGLDAAARRGDGQL